MTLSKNRYCLPELDELVAHQLAEIRRLIAINAETYAHRNLPPPDNNNIGVYWGEDHRKFQGLVDEVNRHLQIKTSIHEVAEHKQVTESRLQDVHNRQTANKEKGHQIEVRLKGKKEPYSHLIVLLAHVATGILCMFDSIYNIQVFTAWGSGYAEAMVLGLFFGFLVATVTHFFKWIVSFGKTPFQKRLIVTVIFSVMACLFTYMAMHRALYLEQQALENTKVHFQYSPIPFIIISQLIFSATVAINYFYVPSRELRHEMREYRKLISDKLENEVELERLKQEERAIEIEYLEVRQLNASIIEYGQSLEAIIINKAHEGLSLFIKHNMMHRRDNAHPQYADHYPFEFNTNFHPKQPNP
ncbi:hypothetical protein KXQ82_01975 [Mucilaginibacter sp. HMF5004]|uniref:hypothetical protein n=1 Tax=Mucilaginibacter rivuli TaxID=2857527 RepID=UPI001C5F93F6|nr:hypothetical protein [Mucilaginibacter rivuli]MBW4888458.1 hypothetical protein [Mucilaginibacter rivuli]